MNFTYQLLALSICAFWLPSISIGGTKRLEPWGLVFGVTLVYALHSGVIEPAALPALLVLATSAWVGASRFTTPRIATGATIVAVLISVALALHVFPGFHSQEVIGATRLSLASTPYTLRANFDKAAAGMLMLAFLCRRINEGRAIRSVFALAVPIALLTSVATLLLGVLIGYVAWDPKVPGFTLEFLAVNLLFVCVAEEAFFRGVLLERLDRLFARWSLRYANFLALSISSAIFGLVHYGGGAKLVALAAVSGMGAGWAYIAANRRIEAPILVHFTLNAAHFLLFTYPRA